MGHFDEKTFYFSRRRFAARVFANAGRVFGRKPGSHFARRCVTTTTTASAEQADAVEHLLLHPRSCEKHVARQRERLKTVALASVNEPFD